METKESVWRRRVARWRESGLDTATFAKRERINARTLTWWRWKLGAGRKKASKAARKVVGSSRPAGGRGEKEAPRFVELQLGAIVEAGRFEVVIGGGRRVVVPPDFDAGSLSKLLEVLEVRP
jgi:hypothetical protein